MVSHRAFLLLLLVVSASAQSATTKSSNTCGESEECQMRSDAKDHVLLQRQGSVARAHGQGEWAVSKKNPRDIQLQATKKLRKNLNFNLRQRQSARKAHSARKQPGATSTISNSTISTSTSTSTYSSGSGSGNYNFDDMNHCFCPGSGTYSCACTDTGVNTYQGSGSGNYNSGVNMDSNTYSSGSGSGNYNSGAMGGNGGLVAGGGYYDGGTTYFHECPEGESTIECPAPSDCEDYDDCGSHSSCVPDPSWGCPPEVHCDSANPEECYMHVEDGWGTWTCHPEGHTCACAAGETLCTWVDVDTVESGTYCASSCPIVCADNQQACWEEPPCDCDWTQGECNWQEFCADTATPCPVNCHADQNKCTDDYGEWCTCHECPDMYYSYYFEDMYYSYYS